MSMVYLVCYDVVDDRRRTKVAHLLEGYGLRVQKSVFECVLSKEQYAMLQKKLKRYLNLEEDQLRFYPLSDRCRQKTLVIGFQPAYQIDDDMFIA